MLTGRQCRAARGLLGWSQQELANHAGFSKTAINNFEAGLTSIKQSTEEAIRHSLEAHGIELTDNEGVRIREDRVRILRGDQTLIPLWKEILETLSPTGGEVLILSVNETEGHANYGDKLFEYIEALKQNNITERLLTKHGDRNFIAPKEWYRWLPEDVYNYTTMTFVFGNKVAIMLWKESMLLIIDSPEAAKAEKERFEILWEQAEIPQ
tara:strand:- start:544 stop:1173 length:630 start_codon:yes stop_codon:yes gene_type:complete